MAALTITASNVRLESGTVNARVNRTYGEAVTAVQPVYLDSGQYFKADTSTSTKATVVGVSLIAGDLNGSSIIVPDESKLDLGAILTKGVYYYLGSTAGTIVPYADLTTGEYVTRIGFAESTSVLLLDIEATGIIIP